MRTLIATLIATLTATLAASMLALLAAAGPAHAAGETCQGEPATIVMGDSLRIQGTKGDDVIFVTGDQGTQGISIYGGRGDDLICFGGDLPETTSVDTYVDVTGGYGTDSFAYVGSPGEDYVVAAGVEEVDIRTGEGIDTVRLEGNSFGTGVVDGGPEPSPLNILNVTTNLRDGRVVADLAEDEVRANGVVFRVAGFDRVQGWADNVVLRGDSGGNRLQAWACRATLRGGTGADILRARYQDYGCGKGDMRLFGQGGDDTLEGSVADDVMVGGSGRDRANGRQGRDRCVAEIERKCER